MNIEKLYSNYETAKRALGIATRLGGGRRSTAMSVLNKHRNRLRWAQNGGRKPTYNPDFETRVCGVPCGVVVTYVTKYQPATFHAPAEGGDFEFILVNAKGYRIEWLENKMSDDDRIKLEAEYGRYLAERD